jgi:site-specific DNA-methyltransferase (adenine-specific)
MTCKSYTGKANINIYHGDCMEFMKDKPAKSYDLAICDPPYGLERFKSGGSHLNKYGSENQEWNNVKPNRDYFNYLYNCSENQIIWGGNNFELPTSEYFIIWHKQSALDFSFAMCEMAWTNCRKPAKIFKYLHTENKEIRQHPTQKPVALYKWLLTNYAKPNDKILDTHGGSMSIAIACWDLGFDLDIIELDKDYYDKAVQRFERHINQKQIF